MEQRHYIGAAREARLEAEAASAGTSYLAAYRAEQSRRAVQAAYRSNLSPYRA